MCVCVDQLAQSATATASSTQSSSYPASQGIDGNVDTYWISAAGDTTGAWITLTWPTAVYINQVDIKWYYRSTFQCSLFTLEWDSRDTFQVS